jgi:hypothetical protein
MMVDRITRAEEPIDLMRLFSEWDAKRWKQFLRKHYESGATYQLLRFRYSLQAGMDDLAKKKFNNEKMVIWHLRLVKSIENTLKYIYRKRHPSPLDNHNNKTFYPQAKWKLLKKQRDLHYEKWLRKQGY